MVPIIALIAVVAVLGIVIGVTQPQQIGLDPETERKLRRIDREHYLLRVRARYGASK